MSNLEFKTARRRREPITFTIDDDTYTFTPPKTAGAVLSIIDGDESEVKALFDWLEQGLPEEEARRIEERLRDPDDDLDIPDVANVIRALLEQVSGRPTRPSRDSRRRS